MVELSSETMLLCGIDFHGRVFDVGAAVVDTVQLISFFLLPVYEKFHLIV